MVVRSSALDLSMFLDVLAKVTEPNEAYVTHVLGLRGPRLMRSTSYFQLRILLR